MVERNSSTVSLFDQSLIAATVNIPTLGGVLNFCSGRQDVSDSCSRASQLWKESISRILGKWVVLQRGDIADKDLYEFVKFLAVGIQFKYAMRMDGFNGTWSPNALPYAGVVEDPDLIPQDIYYMKFSIPGMIPLPGTRGYFIWMTIDGNRRTKEIRNFIAGPDMDRNFILAAQFLGETYFNYHYNKLHITNGEFLVDDANYHEDAGARPPFPPGPPQMFTDRVIAAGINPGSGIGHDTPWFVHYGSFAPPIDRGSYTESQYEIVPFTF